METGRRAQEKEEAEGRGGGRGDSKMNPKKQRQKPIKKKGMEKKNNVLINIFAF